MTTGPITFGGLASGLDVNYIIEQLTNVARRPIILAESRSLVLQQQRDAVGSINGSMSTLLARIADLKDPTVVGARGTSVTTTTEQANAVSASATSKASIGTFTVNVSQLATQSKAISPAAIGQAVDANVPLDQAGLDVPFVAGTFTIDSTQFTIPAATPSTAESASAVGAGIDLDVTLDTAGLTIAPSATGTFRINGTDINFDSSVDTLNAIIARINGSDAGVTASCDAGTDQLLLTNDTNGPTAVTYSDVSGNLMEALNFVDGTATPIATEVLGTDHISLNDVISDINGAGIGVTASLSGSNLLELTSASAITLGAGGDTSNFLTATHILESPAGSTRTSVQGLGAANPTVALEDARFTTAIAPSSGSFTINGATIDYDATVDSLQNVIDRINTADAGVTAIYDSYNDVFMVTADTTGSSAISFADVTGNFLAAVGVLNPASQTLGQNAQYSVNGGATQYSSKNTVNDAVTGVTLTFNETTATAVNVEVISDTGLVASRIEAFVEQYNSLMSQIDTFTKFEEEGENGILFGDSTLRQIESRLRTELTGTVLGMSGEIRTLGDIGLSFGVVGSAIGATETLVFDRGKFDEAVLSDPSGVRALLTAFDAGATLEPAGTGSIASISGKPTSVQDSGTYTIQSDALGNLTVTFQPDSGALPVVSTGSIGAGGTNSTIIPGVTLTAHPALVAGTDTITITANQEGAARSLHSLVDTYTRIGGFLDAKDDQMQARQDALNDQIERLEARVQARQDQLVRRFAALETTIARLQSQQQALAGILTQLGQVRPQNNSNNNQ